MSYKDIYSELEPGERLVWRGTPDRFEVLDKQYLKPFILLIAVCSVIDVVLIALYSSYVLTRAMRINIPVLLIINACSLAPVLTSLLNARKTRLSEYCITNQRILHFTDNIKVKEIRYKNCKECKVKKDKAGVLSLRVGRKAALAADSAMRKLSVSPILTDRHSEEISSAVLYSIPEEAIENLSEYMAISYPNT